MGVVTVLLTPLEAGAGSSTTHNAAVAKNREGENLHKKVLAAFLLYFVNNNKIDTPSQEELDRSRAIEHNQEQRIDNTGRNGPGF
jgi:hypothetical protein